MSAVILKHLDALSASMQLALAQIDALRHAVSEPVKAARLSVPDRCAGVEKDRCAVQDGDWVSKATLGNPTARKCQGCGYLESGLTQ